MARPSPQNNKVLSGLFKPVSARPEESVLEVCGVVGHGDGRGGRCLGVYKVGESGFWGCLEG